VPVGPTGCEGSYQDSTARDWFVNASYGLFRTELSFSGSVEPDIFEQMVVVAAGRQIAAAWSVRLAAGAILDGTLSHDGRSHDVAAGWLVSASAAHRWTFGASQRFFATASVTAGWSSASTREDMGAAGSIGLSAGDVRVGALMGVTLANRFAPYVMARGFGGPVIWQLDGQDITGTDQHHYQLGVGSSISLPFHTSALIDVSVLGERSLSIGVGLSL
jgi:hypothetical protein